MAEVDQVRDLQTRIWRTWWKGGRGEKPTDKKLVDKVAEVDQIRDLQKRCWRILWQRCTR